MLPFGVTIPTTVPQGSEFPERLMNNPVYINCIKLKVSPPPLPVYILQSVRGHSAVVLTVTINGMQEIHPVIYFLFLSSVTID